MASASVNQFVAFIFGLIALGLGIASIVIPTWAQVGNITTGVVNQCTTTGGNETCSPIGEVEDSYLYVFQILIIVGIFGAFIGIALFMVALQCGWICIANLGTLIVVLTDLAKIAAIVLFIIDELVTQDDFDFGSKTFFLAFYLSCGSIASSMVSASIGNYAIRLKKREY